jgi:hypothetical protein
LFCFYFFSPLFSLCKGVGTRQHLPPPFHTHTQNTLTVPTCRVHALIIMIKEKKEKKKDKRGALVSFYILRRR